MKLKVNGQPVDITLENEKTVGDFLKAFEEEASQNEATTTAISLNGTQISPDDFDAILNEPLTDSTEIDLSVISKKELIDALHETAKSFADLNTLLPDVPVQLQSGNDADAGATITRLTEAMESFLHITRLSTLFPELYDSIRVQDMDMGTFFEEFHAILKDFEEAMAGKDTVTVGDLAEYEIGPRIKELSESLAGIKL
ncbi:MAG TPA: hypothetical protein DEO40_04410 [Treponema sp.]|nr:hypothetical protein [Treponema sp.]HCA19896.1 hypothetical protein [Treponema sp.]